MKKIKIMVTMLVSILALVLVFSMTACGTKTGIEAANEDYDKVTSSPATEDTYKTFIEGVTGRYSNIATANPLEVVGDGSFALEATADVSFKIAGIDYTQKANGQASGSISIANKVLDMQGTATANIDVKVPTGTSMEDLTAYKGTVTAEIKEDGSATYGYNFEGGDSWSGTYADFIKDANDWISSMSGGMVPFASDSETLVPATLKDVKASIDQMLQYIGINSKCEIYINNGVFKLSFGDNYIGMAFDTENNWAFKSFSIKLTSIDLAKVSEAIVGSGMIPGNLPASMFESGSFSLSMTLARN